ncbi:hypothetical protein M9X92_005055 [Pyricularia oryzae]|nr:hypothetical protein M9X92_005055 [Pyricularia oryzae]
MTALARLLSIGRHHATVSIKHRPLAAKCSSIAHQNHTYSSQKLAGKSDLVAQILHSSRILPSEAEHVGFSKAGEWSGLGDSKAPNDAKSQHSGQLDHVVASDENGETEAANVTPTWMEMCETAVVERHGQHNPPADNPPADNPPAENPKAAHKEQIKPGIIRDLNYFVPDLTGCHLSELATLDCAVIDKYIESVLYGVCLFAQLDSVANSTYKDPKGWLQISSETLQLNQSGQVFQTTIQAHMPDARVVGIGHGVNALGATRAAWLDILIQPEAFWLLKVRHLDPNLAITDITDLCDKPDERDRYGPSMMKIYDVAAACGSVPTVDAMPVTIYSPHDRELIMCYKFSIQAQDLDIDAQAIARGMPAAMKKAKVLFLDKIEALDKMHPAGADESLPSIIGPPKNANQFVKTFLETHRSQHSGLYSHVDVTVELWRPFGNEVNLLAARLLGNGLPVGPTVMAAVDARKITSLASYAAALSLAAAIPTAAREPKSGKPSQDMVPLLEMSLDSSSLGTMTVPRSIRSQVVQRLPASAVEHFHSNRPGARRSLWMHPLARSSLNRRLAARLEAYQADRHLEHIRAQRASLPMNKHRKQLLNLVEGSHFCIVIGATGSGKSTQVPQIILDDAIKQGRGADTRILCLQPRRAAAMWVAQRVASERGERLGESVGFRIRFDARLANRQGGTVSFVTLGILLKQLQDGVQETLDMYSHIVIDEVHERSLELDLLLVVLKKAIAERLAKGQSLPKIILMSASISNQEQLQEYLADSLHDGKARRLPAHQACPILSIPGRTFPVSSIYLDRLLPMIRDKYGEQLDLWLEDKPFKSAAIQYLETETSSEWDISDETLAERHAAYVPIDLVAATIAHIASSASPGDILVFLPGIKEIRSVNDVLRDRQGSLGIDFKDINFNDTSKFRIHFLHSAVSAAEQNKIFQKVPLGCRRIILASNIAETSVTIPDVVHVVDVGKTRDRKYDRSTRITGMYTGWQTKSKAMQRQGRAGRTQEGHYYGLYSEQRRQSMKDDALPEMLKLDLTNTCLSVKGFGFRDSVADFLAAAISPPPPSVVQDAVNSLKAMDALAENEGITSLGHLLLRIPLHPLLGKMILLGVFFRCVGPMIVLCALHGGGSLFEVPPGSPSAAKRDHQQFRVADSDHLSQMKAFNHLRQLEQISHREAVDFARSEHLNFAKYEEAKLTAAQIEQVLINHGLVPPRDELEHRFSSPGGVELNVNSGNEQLLKALLVKGLYPNVAVKVARSPTRMSLKAAAGGSGHVLLGHASVVQPITNHELFPKNSLFVYSELVRQDYINLMFLTNVSHLESPLVLALFGGSLLRPEPHDAVVQQPLSTADGGRFGFAYKVEDPDHSNPQSRTPAETLVQFREHMDVVLDDAFRRLLFQQQRGPQGSASAICAGTPELEDLVDRVVNLLDREKGRVH